MSVINNLLSILAEKGLRQADLCKAINVNSSTVTNWKIRNSDPPAKYIMPICKFLNITPEYLLTGKENKNNEFLSNPDFDDLKKEYKKFLNIIEYIRILPEEEQWKAVFKLEDVLKKEYPIDTIRKNYW